MTDDILISDGTVARVSLNRPKTIHALTFGMCEVMTEAFVRWRDDDRVRAVILDHAEGRGFCAGGDISLLRQSILEDGGVGGRAFFHLEYRLNHMLFTYPKPIVAFMDGVTMGGGVGISQPASYRIATQNTMFAMPETGIGLFPDVGGGWYLSRLPGRLGEFLALTGGRLDGAECLWAGLATHYLDSESLAEAKGRIESDPGSIDAILADLSVEAPPARLANHVQRIDRLFASNNYEDILAAAEMDQTDWSQAELAKLARKSPEACKVALRELAESRKLTDFADEMRMEYRIASRVLVRPDFAEGVRALIVEKTNDPVWTPNSPAEVSTSSIDSIFAPLPPQEEWTPL